MYDLMFIFAGFFVGLIVGLTGVGGGSLMTPILIFFFDVKPYLAVGTDLLFAAFTKMGGTIKLARARIIDWRVVLHLSAGSIPAALITLWVLNRVGAASAQAQSLMTNWLSTGAAFDGVLANNDEMALGAANAAKAAGKTLVIVGFDWAPVTKNWKLQPNIWFTSYKDGIRYNANAKKDSDIVFNLTFFLSF